MNTILMALLSLFYWDEGEEDAENSMEISMSSWGIFTTVAYCILFVFLIALTIYVLML